MLCYIKKSELIAMKIMNLTFHVGVSAINNNQHSFIDAVGNRTTHTTYTTYTTYTTHATHTIHTTVAASTYFQCLTLC